MSKVIPLRRADFQHWEEALETFLTWKKATGLSDRTLSDYRYHVTRFFRIAPHAWDSHDFKTAVYRYLGERVSPATFNIRRKYLKGFFDWALEQGILGQDPFEGVKARRTEPRVVRIPPESLKQLLSLPDCNTFAGLRDKALMMLQLDTGIRPCEALALTPRDYNPAALEVHIRPETAKTRKGRTLILTRGCALFISKLLSVRPDAWRDSPIFCGNSGLPFSVHSWCTRLKRVYGARLGIRISPYDLRHCHALMFLRNNGNLFALQREMGHADIEMTKRYLALNDDDLREAHAKASPLNSLLPSISLVRLNKLNKS